MDEIKTLDEAMSVIYSQQKQMKKDYEFLLSRESVISDLKEQLAEKNKLINFYEKFISLLEEKINSKK